MRKRYLPSQIIGFFTPDAVAGTWVPKHRFLLTCFCIALMGLLLSTNTLQAQSGQCLGGGCSGGSSWGAVQSTTSTTFVSAVSGTFAGEYNTFNVTSGMQYEWSMCSVDGATNPTSDTQLTLRNTGGTNLCYSDDLCGLVSKILWTATFTGQVQVLINQYNCTTNSNSHTMVWRCVTCGGGGYDPCGPLAGTLSCGTSVTSSHSGSGAGWSPGACGWSTPGQERIYSFTATSTGIHQVNVTANNNSTYIDYFWKAASGGCNSSGWTCISDIYFTGFYGSMSFTAGTTYYFLLDPESSGTSSHTFNIVCPASYDPCSPLAGTLSCGSSVTSSHSGSGAGWSPSSCGFTTPGQERIYSFTATSTGIHQVNVTASSGGYVDYFWKIASGGCNSSGWNCIDDIGFTGIYGSMSFTAGTTYYFLLDPEGTGSYSHTFNIVCPASYDPCSPLAGTLSCGSSVTSSHSGSGAGWSPSACGWSTPGQERIYSFTATSTGIHQVNVTANNNSTYIDYFWKAASGGCNSSGWNCIDDIYSTGIYGSMSFTAGTTYYFLLDPESSGASSHTFNIVCPASYDPCSPLAGTLSCGSSVTSSHSGSGAGWSPSSCGFTTPGQEKIYSFTATSTGIHQVNVTANNNSTYIDYFWKAASGGCNSSGWTCIDDIYSTGIYGSMSFTAGTTYYFLLDPESSGASSHTFNIVCPAVYDPCSPLAGTLSCGSSVTSTHLGSGASWNPYSCLYGTPGQERIYSFTATSTGIHQVNVTASSGGYVDYFWKIASGGCNSSGWTCIDDINSPGIYGSMSFTAGTTYYILLDPEGIGSYSHTFNIVCPASCTANAGNLTPPGTLTVCQGTSTGAFGAPTYPAPDYQGNNNGAPSPATDYFYLYLLVNPANIVMATSSNGSFSTGSLTPACYNIIGMSYRDIPADGADGLGTITPGVTDYRNITDADGTNAPWDYSPGTACMDISSPVGITVFPAIPATPVVSNTCGSALSVSALAAFSGFTAQYSFDNGAIWGTSTMSPSTVPGCYSILRRYVTSAACGSTPAGSVGPCTLPTVVNAGIFPAIPATPAVTNTCGTALFVSSLPFVTGFTAQYSFDNGSTWSTSTMSPSTVPGCYSILRRYITNTACGSTPAGSVGPCTLPAVVNAVIFPTIPATPAVTNTCASALYVQPLPFFNGFTEQYSYNNGSTWTTSNFSPTTPGCYSILRRYVTSAACGSTPAGNAGPCTLPTVVNAVVFPTIPATPPITSTCNSQPFTVPTLPAVAGFTAQYSFDNGVSWGTNNISPSSPGTYKVLRRYVLSSACGSTPAGNAGPCTLPSVVNVTISDDPTVGVVLGGGDGNQKIDFFTVAMSCKPYSWTYSITGGPVTATKTTKVLIVNHNCNNYTVTISACGCSKTFNGGTSCKEDGEIVNESFAVELYPNPVSHELTIMSNRSFVEVRLFNLSGKQVQTQVVAETFVSYLDVSDLPNGLYAAQIITSNGETSMQKIVVSK